MEESWNGRASGEWVRQPVDAGRASEESWNGRASGEWVRQPVDAGRASEESWNGRASGEWARQPVEVGRASEESGKESMKGQALHTSFVPLARHKWDSMPAASSQSMTGKRKRRVAALAYMGWSNALVLKDCGLVPYLLHKRYGFEAMLLGRVDGELSSLRYVDGVRAVPLPNGTMEEHMLYLVSHAGEIDLLTLYGGDVFYQPIIEIYKKYNPAGKVYLALDPNLTWTDRVQWRDPIWMKMMDDCDLIASSGHVLQKHLNEKWPWAIDYIPNGYYHFTDRELRPSFSEKENIILSVSRLGTREKRTDLLLEAFASIASEIPDWRLRLVGGIEDVFRPFLSGFFEAHPELRERISFSGHLKDRDALYDEYLRAKIFALPSYWECGTPNVISEALSLGCVTALTAFDEWRDASENGKCGMAVGLMDREGYGRMLLSLCRSAKLSEMSLEAVRYAHENYDMRKIVDRLHAMLFLEDLADKAAG